VAVLDASDASALDLQVGTGLLAVIVPRIVTTWCSHRGYRIGWIAHHSPLPTPDRPGIWFVLSPTAASIVAQVAALVIGSYAIAKDMRVSRLRRRGEIPATHPELAPTARKRPEGVGYRKGATAGLSPLPPS